MKNLQICNIFEDGKRPTLNQPLVRHAGRKMIYIKTMNSTKPNQTAVTLPVLWICTSKAVPDLLHHQRIQLLTMQQSSSPDSRIHINQPEKHNKKFPQLLKPSKRFSLQATANLQPGWWFLGKNLSFNPNSRNGFGECGKSPAVQPAADTDEGPSPQLSSGQARRELL